MKIVTMSPKDVDPNIKKIVDLYENNIDEQLKLGADSDLFKLLNELSKNEFDPSKSKFPQVFSFPEFVNLLGEKEKKLYLNKTNNTIHEYEENGEKKAVLVQYISLEAKVENEEDINICLQRLAKLFTFLVNKEIVLVTLGDVIAIPFTHKDKVSIACFGLWVGLKEYKERENNSLSSSSFKQFNELVGFDVFTHEGDTINDFDWTQLDKL